MSRVEHKLAASRRLPTPSWALNRTECAELLTAYYESKIGPRLRLTNGTLKERVEHAQRALLATTPKLIQTMTELCREFVKENDKARKRQLARRIRELDTRVCLLRRPAVVVRLIWCYYCRGLTSRELGRNVSCSLCTCAKSSGVCTLHGNGYKSKKWTEILKKGFG